MAVYLHYIDPTGQTLGSFAAYSTEAEAGAQAALDVAINPDTQVEVIDQARYDAYMAELDNAGTVMDETVTDREKRAASKGRRLRGMPTQAQIAQARKDFFGT